MLFPPALKNGGRLPPRLPFPLLIDAHAYTAYTRAHIVSAPCRPTHGERVCVHGLGRNDAVNPINNSLSGGYDRRYVRLSSPTFHCCVIDIPPLIGQPRETIAFLRPLM